MPASGKGQTPNNERETKTILNCFSPGWIWYVRECKKKKRHCWSQGHREGGRGVQWPRGPWTLGPMGFRKTADFSGPSRGPIEMTLRNQHVRPEDLFFGDHLILTKKNVRISVKTFFSSWRSLNFNRKSRQNFGEDLFFSPWRSFNFDRKNRQNFGKDLFLEIT